MRRRLVLAVAVVAMTAAPAMSQNAANALTIHSVTDISHEFTFYFDGRFHGQYLKDIGGTDARNWGTLHKYDLANVNLLVLQSGATPCPYTAKDIAAVTDFLESGGGVVVLGSYAPFRTEATYRLNELAKAFEAEFVDVAAKEPLTPAPALGVPELKYYGGKVIELARPDEWEVLVSDADGLVVMARRPVGKGKLLIASRGLSGHQPDAKDPINAEMWQPLLADLASGKPIDPAKPPQGAMPENVTDRQGLKVQCSDYLQPMADIIFEQYDRALPKMQEILGVPPHEGMLTNLILLPTGGGGFSSGVAIGLGVWWGGFPDELYGMVELIGHEATHSWVLPFAEPIWNEPIATYVGILLARELGLDDEADAALERVIEEGLKQDPDMTKYDLAYGTDVPNAVVWGKTMWIWEELRREKPDVLARYFQAKRRLAVPGELEAYTPDDVAAVLSVAMERDMFPWLQSLGLTVDRRKASIRAE